MVKKIFLLIFLCSTFTLYAQELEMAEASQISTPKEEGGRSSSSIDTNRIFQKPIFYVADIFGFGEGNSVDGETAIMQNLKNDIQASVTLPFRFTELYTLKLTLADRFRVYGSFKRGVSEFDDNVDMPRPHSVDLRNRLYVELNNSFSIIPEVNVDFGLGMRFDSHASSHTDDAVSGRPRDLSPQLLFYPFVSLSGRVENFSYSLYNFDAFYFNTGDTEAFQFRDEVEINLNVMLNYDFSSLITKNKDFGLGLTAFMESYTYMTKGINRTQKAIDKDLIAFSGFDADIFLLLEGKLKYFRPVAGLFMKTKNGSRLGDTYVADFYVGGDIGAIVEYNNFYFGVNYKGGKQVNRGAAVNYIPNKFVGETAIYFGYVSNGASPLERLLVNQ